MGFRLLILAPPKGHYGDYVNEGWPERLQELIPDIDVSFCRTAQEAAEKIEEADAAFGEIDAKLFARAKNLRWIASPLAGPRAGYYHRALIESDVTVTNVRGVYSDHISAHIMAFVLSFARGLHAYVPQQLRRMWRPGHETVYLPEATAVVVGVGGIGGETARLCSEFGMTVVGVDARLTKPPPGVAELHTPEALADVLPRGDFVIVTVPETPETQGMFAAPQFRLMKPGAYFVNIGRGATVVLNDLIDALQRGEIAGAGLDVFEVEPLEADHPLWTTPGVLITPHVASAGPYLDERRTKVFFDNCVRFNEGRPLRNVVDKARWF